MRADELPALRRRVEHADLSESSLDSILRDALSELNLVYRRASLFAAPTDAGRHVHLLRARSARASIPFPQLTSFAVGASVRTHENHLLRGSNLE